MRRCPWYLSPAIYTGFIVWTVLVSNPLMTLLGYLAFDTKPETDAWVTAMRLGVTTAGCVAGLALTLLTIKPEFRRTFYRHETLSHYVRNFEWDCSTNIESGKLEIGCSRELVWARRVMCHARCYVSLRFSAPSQFLL